MTEDISENKPTNVPDEAPAIYIKKNPDGTVYAITIYNEFQLDGSENSIIAGAYYGYSGGATNDGGFYVSDNENIESYVMNYEELESRRVDGCDVSEHQSYLMQKIWELICEDDNTLSLTNLGKELFNYNVSSDIFISDNFDGDLLSVLSRMWQISLRF